MTMTDDRSSEPPGHDARRELEHKALRNVRGLVDRMEADDQAKNRSQKVIVAVLLAGVFLAIAVLLLMIRSASDGNKEIVVEPSPGAPRR
jgi:uncharacterized membrane-anchored protein YitT (DUF2179 family)